MNFNSFVFAEAGRRLLNEEGLRLGKFGWELAELHEDRRDVSVRFHEQERRDRVLVHALYEKRLEDARKEYDELVEVRSDPRRKAEWLSARRARMNEAKAWACERREAEIRRMQSLVDDLKKWEPEEVLVPLKTSLLADAEGWRPAAIFEELPDWARSDERLVEHDFYRSERQISRASEELDAERAKVARLNVWLAAMRKTFGPEPEGYWGR